MNNAVYAAGEVLNRAAVTFETDRRYNNQNAWPFWFPFIPKPYLNTDIFNNGLGLLGIRIPAGQTRDIPIQIDRDSVYRLINVKYTPYRCSIGRALEVGNTMSVTVGSTTMTGVGTAYLTTVSKGDHISWLDDNSNIQFGTVDSITSNTVLILEEAANVAATGVAMFTCNFVYYDTVPAQQRDVDFSADLTGTITTVAGALTFVGVGTDFDAEVVVGESLSYTDDDGNVQIVVVDTITNDTNIVLAGPAPTVGTGVAFQKVNALEGSITVAPGGAAMVGVDTEFVTDLTVGDVVEAIDVSGVKRHFIIDTITDATNIIIAETLAATDPGVAAGTSFRIVARVQTGTVTVTAVNRLVTGGGTAFTEELKQGDFIFYEDAAGICVRCPVSDIISDTELKSSQPVTASGAGVTYALGMLTNRANIITLTGTIGIAASGTAVVGVGTVFTEELTVGQKISVTDDDGNNIIVEIETITNDTAIVLRVAIGTTAVTAGAAFFVAGALLPGNLFNYRPLTQFLRVTAIMTSLRTRYLYGGSQTFISPNAVANGGNQERPQLISSLQGIDDGLGQLRTAAIFGYDSSFKIRVTNLYTEDILLNGTLFGYKITLGD